MNATCRFNLNHPQWKTGRLTTEHASSSYGQPVVVGDDGQSYGPGDIFLLMLLGGGDEAEAAALRAGYQLCEL